MNKGKWIFFATLLIVLAGFSMQLFAQVKDAPASVAAAMLLKVAVFEKNVSSTGEINIFVLGADEVADELKKGVGKPVGKSTLKSVDTGSDLPSSKPTILFCGDAAKLDDVLGYCKSNKVLSVTGAPENVSKGIALGFGVGEDNKPKILLNLTASSECGLDWNPAILKVAQTVK